MPSVKDQSFFSVQNDQQGEIIESLFFFFCIYLDCIYLFTHLLSSSPVALLPLLKDAKKDVGLL